MPKKRILVDLDQILVALNEQWLKDYNQAHDDNVTVEDITTWNIENHVKADADVFKIIERDGYFADLDPLPGAVDGFKRLRNSGHDVRVCSSPASADSAKHKYLWCEKHLGIGRRDVFIMHAKDWLAPHCDVIIDDKPDTIRKWVAAGKDAMTIAYPYNRDVADICAVYAEGYKDTEAAWEEIVAALT